MSAAEDRTALRAVAGSHAEPGRKRSGPVSLLPAEVRALQAIGRQIAHEFLSERRDRAKVGQPKSSGG